jgi:P-type Cu+ transporter
MSCCPDKRFEDKTGLWENPYFKPVLLIAIGMGLSMGGFLHVIPNMAAKGQIVGAIEAVVTLYLLWFAGAGYYRTAWQSLKKMRFNMSTLVALGTGAAVFYSLLVLLIYAQLPPAARHMHFDAALMIMGVILFGAAIETALSVKTHHGIDLLMQQQPKTAWVLSGKTFIEKNVETLKIGDTLQIRSGDKAPLDCIIVAGESAVNLSLLTGESATTPKRPGDHLPTGALVDGGSLRCKVTHTMQNSTLAQITQLVENAQKKRPETGKLANQIAKHLTPLVMLIAALTATTWLMIGSENASTYALTCALSVLLVACPCALNMAVPMSLMAGINRAVGFGLLIQSGQALQKTAAIDTIFLDKTGTLTMASPKLTHVMLLGKKTKNEVLKMAQALEMHSSHPIAKAILAESTQGQALSAQDVKTLSGRGLEGKIEGHTVRIGQLSFIEESGLLVPDTVKAQRDQAACEGKTVMLLTCNQTLLGLLMVEDPIKPDAAELITWCRQQGMQTVMLTGDHPQTAAYVNQQLGLDAMHAGCLPQDKHRFIQQAKTRGETVAMVGDGINDAAALALADVGFAMGSGSDVALANADMQLLNPSFATLIQTFGLAQAVMRNIKQNLWVSLIYNILLIPVAAGVLYPHFGILLNPVMASLAMSCSSISVVLNALRLNRYSA